MTNDEGLDLEELDLDDVPTAAYEVWAKEENEEDKMEIFRNLPKVATVHNELYRDNDVEEALKEAVEKARREERRRIQEKIINEIEGHARAINRNPPDVMVTRKYEPRINALNKALEELEEEVEE